MDIAFRGIIVIVCGFGLVNGLVMLISPPVWFRLPRWIGEKGLLTEHRFAFGWGAAWIRFWGAVVLAGSGYVLYELFGR